MSLVRQKNEEGFVFSNNATTASQTIRAALLMIKDTRLVEVTKQACMYEKE